MNILVLATGSLTKTLIEKVSREHPGSHISVLALEKEAAGFKRNSHVFEIIPFTNNGFLSLVALRRTLRSKKIDAAIIPQSISQKNTYTDFISSRYFLFLRFCGITDIQLLDAESGTSFPMQKRLFHNLFSMLYLFFIVPFLCILAAPMFFFKELLPAFFIRIRKEPEFYGFRDIPTGSHVYYLTKAKMARKYGLFGIAHADYMGTPVTLHRTPLDVLLLRGIGYLGFLSTSVLLMIIAFSYLIVSQHSYLLFLLLPFVFLSTYFMKSVVISHTEFLAWGFFLLTLVSYSSSHPYLAAIFLIPTFLSHVNIGFLSFLSLFSYMIGQLLQGFSLSDFFIQGILMGTIFLAGTLFFIVPFLRTLRKLSRGKMINDAYNWRPRWSPETLMPLFSYLLFYASLYVLPFSPLHLLAIIPLLTLWYNTKSSWMFSEHTLELFMLFTATFVVFSVPHPLTTITFLFMVFRSPLLLTSDFRLAHTFYYHLEPVKPQAFKTKFLRLIKSLPSSSRIALEAYPRYDRKSTYEFNAFLSSIIVDTPLELMNGFGAEFVEYPVYRDLVQHLNPSSSPAKIRDILKKSGSQYILAYDPLFQSILKKQNYREVGRVTDPLIQESGLHSELLLLFKAPFRAPIIEPEAVFSVHPNHITFTGKKGKAYTMHYNHYPAWRAFQNGKRLTIKDAEPGMIIHSPADAPITIEYKYRYYWF